MPEDMKELFRQQQRELAAERAEYADEAKEQTGDENTTPTSTTEPKMDQVTLPPPPKADEAPAPAPKAETEKPKTEPTPPAATRPREADTQKKKGKKGDGEP